MNEAFLGLAAVGALALAGAARRGARNESTRADYDPGDMQITGFYEENAVSDIFVARSAAELNSHVNRYVDDCRFLKLPQGLGGYLGGIELPKEVRGKQIGEQLVRKMLDVAKVRGLKYVVILSETRPRSFWRKMGFVETPVAGSPYVGLTPMIWKPDANPTPAWLVKAGRLAKRWTHTNESLHLLDELYEGMDWGCGGCAVLARAMCEVEPRLERYGVFDARGQVQHLYAGCVVEGQVWLVDRDGLQTQDQAKRVFLQEFSGEWMRTPGKLPVFYAKLTPKTKMGEILDPIPFAHRVAKALKEHASSRKGSPARDSFRRVEKVPRGFTQESEPFLVNTVLEDVPSDGLYHVTTNLSAVLASGKLKSRAELHRMNVTTAGLGGGGGNEAPNQISVTVSRERAFRLLEGILAMAGAAQGRLGGTELLQTLERLSDSTLWTLDNAADYLGDSTETVNYYDAKEKLEAAVKNAKRGVDLYSAAQRYEGHLNETLHEWIYLGHVSDDDMLCGWPVGFTEEATRFQQITVENLGIVRVAARREACPDIVSGECELRFKPEDLQITGVLEVSKRMLRVLD